jgi:predicted permease
VTPAAPPRLARLLLRAVLRGNRRAEIAADLEHLFASRAGARGLAYARRRYWRDVLSFSLPRRTRAPRATPRRGGLMLAALIVDLRHLLRGWIRRPAFFVVAASTLGVGFAAYFAAFTAIDQLLLSPPAHVQEPGALFRVHVDRADGDGRFTWYQTPYATYRQMAAGLRSFDGLTGYRPSTASLGMGADARMLRVAYADGNYFDLLGVRPRLGRFFSDVENQPPSGTPVLVLGYALWQSMFQADPEVLGRDVRLGANVFTVIGVAPPGFTGTHAGYSGEGAEATEAWAPLFAGAHELPEVWTTSQTFRSVTVLARVADGVGTSAASQEAAAFYQRTVEGTRLEDPTARVLLSSLQPGRRQDGSLTAEARIALWLGGVALLVLAVAVANVVNLQLSRATERRREMALRLALGAGRARLMTQLIAEAAVIAVAGAAAGAGLAWMASGALQSLLLPGQPVRVDVGRFVLVSSVVVAFCVVTSAAFAMLQLFDEGLSGRLKTGRGGDGFGRARLRQALLVTQVAVSAVLLVGAGLFVRSMMNLGGLRFGMDIDRVLVVQLPLAHAGFTEPQIEDFYARALESLAQVPGVEHVAAGQSAPFNPSLSAPIAIPGRDSVDVRATYYAVTPGHFATMGTPILRGRGFADSDRDGTQPVMIVEQALGERLWPGEDPIGKCVIVGAAGEPCREVVGIAGNTRRFVSTATNALRYYLPLAQRRVPLPPQVLFVRTAGPPELAVDAVRGAILSLGDTLPFARIRVLASLAEPETRPWRLGSTLFLAFGLIAVFVASAGVHALLSFMVEQRWREIGVRLALGATPARTVALVVGQSGAWAAAGVVIGLAVAAACGGFVQPMLFETSPYDPVVFAGAAGLLLGVAAAASARPAFRAGSVDPTVALRSE